MLGAIVEALLIGALAAAVVVAAAGAPVTPLQPHPR